MATPSDTPPNKPAGIPGDTQIMDNTRNPVVSLASIMRRLSEVIHAENDLIHDRRPGEIKHLQEEKGRLSAAYAKEMEFVRKNGGVSAFASADQLRELKRQTKAFNDLVENHRKLVERSRAITEGMLRAIGQEVARRNESANGYGNNALPPRPRTAAPATLTLNQVI